MWPVNAEKKCFHCIFAKYTLFKSPEIPPYARIKTSWGMWQFFNVFPLSIFSVLRLTQIEAKKKKMEQFLAAGVGGSWLYWQIWSFKTQNLTITDFNSTFLGQFFITIQSWSSNMSLFFSSNKSFLSDAEPLHPQKFCCTFRPNFPKVMLAWGGQLNGTLCQTIWH